MSDLLKPGQVFAERYRILNFLAEATELKVLWPQIVGSSDAIERFQLEARVAGRVNSEHIVRVLDAGFDGATRMPFLVMELLNGESLHEAVRLSGPIPPDVWSTYLRHQSTQARTAMSPAMTRA